MYLLLITTIVGFLSVHSSMFTKYISKYLTRIPRAEKELLRERYKLAKEQQTLSLSRDFVKYSKLQRKINAIDVTLKDKKEERSGSNFVYHLAITYGSKIILTLVMLFLSVYYRKVPVFIVESKYNLYPFGGLISFPNDYVNAVSVHFWMMCCSSVAQLLKT